MRAGGHHTVVGKVMRQIDTGARIRKAKLQDLHAGYAYPLPQSVDLRRNQSQVFGNEGQAAEVPAQGVEEVVPRALDPAPLNGCGLRRRYFPVTLKAAEVVEADQIKLLQRPGEPLHPPVIVAGAQDVPAVERVAPALSGG